MDTIKIFENEKDLTTFEKLLKAVADFTDAYPATGLDQMFTNMLNNKTKIMPKDKNAIAILDYVSCMKTTPAGVVQQLLNLRFGDLPMEVRPIYDLAGKKTTAYWRRGNKVYDKVVSLLDFAQEGDVKGFVDEKGEKVEIVDIAKE
jgi:hypothetical protein